MSDRILDISDRPAYLSVRNDLLVIRFAPSPPQTPPQAGRGATEPSSDVSPPPHEKRGPAGGDRAEADGGEDTAATESPPEDDAPYRHRGQPRQETHTIPLSDVAALIVSHPQASYTHAVLPALAAAGAIFVACDEKHLPAAMLLPLVTHSTQTERIGLQAALSLPTRKRLWQQIVHEQILARARLLEERTGQDWGLGPMASQVRSGDPQNLEARAARLYWQNLFPGRPFHRDPEAEGLNSYLNYGYAVLRAIVARALCGSGLHPSLGLHHHNRYDPFCLADDLMEPFRPLVDRVIAGIRDRQGDQAQLEKESKKIILEGLLGRFAYEGEARTLFDWMTRTASSLAAVIEGTGEKLEIPYLEPVPCNL
jgi:CRISPR-associated protein Cas1